MSEPEKSADEPAGEPAGESAGKPSRRAARSQRKSEKSSGAGAKVRGSVVAVRNRIGALIWLVAVVCALILAAGALLIALKANQDNGIVKLVLDVADVLDLGVFSRDNGIFTFSGHDHAVKAALVNWGIAAVAYLVVGKILERVVRR